MSPKLETWPEEIDAYRSKIRGFNDIDIFVRKFSYGKILEVGCGELPYFSDSFKIDIVNLPRIDLAHDLNKKIPLRRKFDTVVGIEIIEHLWNTDCFLSECNRLLKKNGSLILSTPNVLYWRNRLQVLLGDDSWFDNKGVHLWYFSPRSLTKKLKEYNFQVLLIKPLGWSRIFGLNYAGGFVCLSKKC